MVKFTSKKFRDLLFRLAFISYNTHALRTIELQILRLRAQIHARWNWENYIKKFLITCPAKFHNKT